MSSTKAINLQVGHIVLNSKGDKERGTVTRVDIEPQTVARWEDGKMVKYDKPGEFNVRAYSATGGLIVQARDNTRVKIAS